MLVNKKHYRTIWINEQNTVKIIDQRSLPHQFVTESLTTVDQTATAIKDMHVRGAGLIGATAGYGMFLAALEGRDMDDNSFYIHMAESAKKLIATRPTAKNLEWAVERQKIHLVNYDKTIEEMIETIFKDANKIADEDAEMCESLGIHGLPIIQKIYHEKQQKQLRNLNDPEERKRYPKEKLMKDDAVYVMTHCNAGELAFVEWGSATAPIYKADELGIPVHVLVSETRPRLQGANLTAWELDHHGVSHEIITDNEAAHRMQRGHVDLVITGADRATYTGDVANKIGTLQKAICAQHFNIPFYVALPSSTFDWNIRDGVKDIPIEQRSQDEVKYINGKLIAPEDSPASNYAFDVTPRQYITGLITERGICEANEESILGLFPEHKI